MARSQWKLAAVLSALVLLVVGLVGFRAEQLFSQQLLDQRHAELRTALAGLQASLADLSLTDTPTRALYDEIEPIAEAAVARVTLVDRSGKVVADSALPAARVDRFENHGDRPEIQAAWSEGLGSAVRHSASLDQKLLYVAVPTQSGDGAIRLAVPLETGSALSAFRRWLLEAFGLGLVAALVLSVVLARSNARSVEHMRRVATQVAEGDLSARVRRHTGDELDPIAGAIDRIAEQLRLRLEEATQEKERLGAVLNGMVEGVLVVDLHGKIVLVNERARGFFGIAAGSAEGRPLLEVVRHAELHDLLDEATHTEEAVAREIQLGPRGERVLGVQAARFPRGAAARLGTVAVFHDVTELMRLEQVRRDFVANASHELRTPLAAISGFAETLLSNRSLAEEDRRRYIEVIDRHAERLTHLVTDLLELSRIESRRVELEVTAVDVAELAERIVEDLHEVVGEKDLIVSVERRGRPRARADAGALEQVLVNLVDNAIKYTEPGGEIVVRVEEDGGEIAVAIRDDGIGIPLEDQERIFERFYRVDKARSRELGGTGLGLAIVKHLVQSQGGTIRVESEPGRGSTFHFTLPREAGPSPEPEGRPSPGPDERPSPT